jgi:hypothetical protein
MSPPVIESLWAALLWAGLITGCAIFAIKTMREP